jgi:hypothetical protein
MKRIVVLGSLNIDLVSAVERLPRLGETLVGGDLAIFEGGKGANQACAAGRLGGAVTMIGQVGVDPPNGRPARRVFPFCRTEKTRLSSPRARMQPSPRRLRSKGCVRRAHTAFFWGSWRRR